MADEKDNDKKNAPAAPAAAAAAPSGKSPLTALMLVVNAFALAGVGFMQYKAMEKASLEPTIQDVVKAELKSLEEEKTVKQDKPGNANLDGPTMALDPFTANLAQGDGPRRFIRLNTVLQFNKDAKEAEFKARKPQIRDTIISLLNSKRPEDLLTKEGKDFLREEVKASINSYLVDGQVTDVYYVGFQIN